MVLNRKVISIALATLLTMGSFLFIDQHVSGAKKKQNSDLENQIETIIEGHEENIGIFISTKDGDVGFNEDKVYSSASTIKVPILAEGLKQADKGIINLDEKTTVSSSDITAGGGIIRQLSANQVLSIRDLMYLMIILSDNTATNMVIDRVGMNAVNQACKEMGCEDTKLQRKMLESVEPKDNLTTAKDMSIIYKEVYEGDFLKEKEKKEFLRMLGDQKLSSNLPAYKDKNKHKDVDIYHKGGSLGSTNVNHDVGMMVYEDEVVYVSVLTEEMSKKSLQIMMAEIGEVVMDYLVEE